jgi:hypothetical protein
MAGMEDAIPPVIDVVTKGVDWTSIVTGVVGVSGIIGTYWQGKRSREATSQDLRDTLQADTNRALRADRRGVYANFQAAINKVTGAFLVLEDEWHATEGDARVALRSRYIDTITGLAAALAQVKLVAPDAIGDVAQGIADLIADYFNAITNDDEAPDYNALVDDIDKRRKLLYKAMRADLVVSADKTRHPLNVAAPATADVLDRLRQREPACLERLALSLLTSVDYGSPGKGLDGVIRQDPLGMVRIYVQANRDGASTAVGYQEIRKFVVALHKARADGGIFVTTGHFTTEAITYARRQVAARVVLIDGLALCELMVRRNRYRYVHR